MKKKVAFFTTAIILHAYLAVSLCAALFEQKKARRPIGSLNDKKLKKHQPSTE